MQSLIKLDAEKWVEGFLPHSDRKQVPEDYQAAYEEGALQVLRYLQQFAARVNASTPMYKTPTFQEGQTDGVLWTVDYVSGLFGIE